MTRDGGTVGGRLLLGANVLFANVAAVLWAVSFAFPSAVGESPESGLLTVPMRSRTAWAVLGAALLLLVCNVAFVLRRRPREPLRFVQSEAPGGAVRVSRDALEIGLRAAGEALPEITRLRIAVESGGLKKVLVRGQFQCPEGFSNLEASKLLRHALGERFAEMVQLTDGTGVEMQIEFVGFAGKLRAKAPEEPPESEDEPSSFTGPQYPIDEGSEERGES